MEVFNSLNFNKDLSLALGFFDGVHIAHKKILMTASALAKENGIKSAVITFKKSPRSYFCDNKIYNIQTLNERLECIKKTGIDFAYVLDFKDFKDLSAGDYLNDVLIKHFDPKFITTGYNHTFGHHKYGDSNFLREHQNRYKYIEIDKMKLNNDIVSALVSSTNIKKFIEKAYIKEANSLLGYSFNISGTVIKGMGLARNLGFRTANIEWNKDIVKPPYGVYFALVELTSPAVFSGYSSCHTFGPTDSYNPGTFCGKKYPAILNWGIKPTVNDPENPLLKPVLEAHILDFNQDIYGKKIRVHFLEPIREEKKFNNLEELRLQITDDIRLAEKLAQQG